MEQKLKGEYDENGNYKAKITMCYFAAMDKVGEEFLPLFPAKTKMRAIRMLEDTINDKSTPIGKHPEDYALYKILEIDMRTGEIIDNKIEKVMEGAEYGK